MSQLKVSANFENGNAAVVVPNQDLRGTVYSGYLLYIEGELAAYYLGADPTYSVPDSTLNLTAPYAGTTGVKDAVIVCDYTSPDNIPLINPGDVNTASIFTEGMKKVQQLLTSTGIDFALQKANNLSDLADAAAARTNLGLGNVQNLSAAQIIATLTQAALNTAVGGTSWSSGNDGAGSGLDADLLDGQHGAYYQNASNLNAGTVAPARMGTGTPSATTFVDGSGAWRTLVAADVTTGLGYTPVNRAGDTMQGDLNFATTKKIVQVDEWGVKWQLSGSSDYIELNQANTSWDFNRATGGVNKWRFIDGLSTRFQIDSSGLTINGLGLKTTAAGLLSIDNGTVDEEFRIYSRHDGTGLADWEALGIGSTSTGHFIYGKTGGVGAAKNLNIGTMGDANVTLVRNGQTRWALSDTALYPYTTNTTDLGDSTHLVQNIWLGKQIVTPLGTGSTQPPIAAAGDLDTGMRWPAAGQVAIVTNGVDRLSVTDTKIDTNGLTLWFGANAKLTPEELGALAQKDGVTPQTFRVYYSDDGAGNYTRGSLGWSGTTLRLGTDAAGTGIVDPVQIDGASIQLATAGTTRLQVNASDLQPVGVFDLGDVTSRFRATYSDALRQVVSYTDASNYEWAEASWATNEWILGSYAAGTGQYHNVVIRAGSGSSIGHTRFGADSGSGIGSISLEDDSEVVHVQLYTDANGAYLKTLQGKVIQLTSAANTVEVVGGVAAQAFNVYNTTDGTNYERGEFRWTGSGFVIGTGKGGSGLSRDLQFAVGGSPLWAIVAASGAFVPTSPDNVDLGSGTNTIKDIYLAGTIHGGTFAGSATLSGTATAPTPAAGDNSTNIATTAWVTSAVAGSVAGVSSFNTRTGAVTLTDTDVTGALGYTPLNQTSYTAADVLAKIKTVDGTTSGLDADLLDGHDGSYYAPLASPVFSGAVGIGVAGGKPLDVFDTIRVQHSTLPRYQWYATSGTANQRKWQMYISGTSLRLAPLNDAESAEGIALEFSQLSTLTRNGVALWDNNNSWVSSISNGVSNVLGTLYLGGSVSNGSIGGLSGFLTISPGDGQGGSVLCGGYILPNLNGVARDNTYALGTTGQRWQSVWAANGTIQTSDVRQKAAIRESELGLEFINDLHPVSYKWIDGGADFHDHDKGAPKEVKRHAGRRRHFGLIAQEVKAAIDKAGIEDFGGWILGKKDDPDSEQGLNYAQFIAPLIKAVQQLSAKVAALEAKGN